MAQGCDPASLLKEVSSYDTVGNAYFSLTIHSIPAGWRKILVNTSVSEAFTLCLQFSFVHLWAHHEHAC